MENVTELFSSSLGPFTAAAVALVTIAVLELLMLSLAGNGLSDIIEALVSPDSLAETAAANWLFLRDTPFVLWLCALLAGFAFGGWSLQFAAHALTGEYLAAWAAIGFAAVFAVLTVRGVGRALQKAKFTTTAAVHPDSFVGRTAVMTCPTVNREAATAKLTDEHGYTHLLLVEPESNAPDFEEGQAVRLVGRKSLSVFTATDA